MGLIPSALRLLIELHKNIHFKGRVITLGNQDIYATYNDLQNFFEDLNCPYKKPHTVFLHTSASFGKNPKTKYFVHARTFFEMMGIDEYYDIDKFAQERPIITHDLDIPVPAQLQNRFSFVLDGGTMEHIFDIKQVMFNIVQMLEVGGWVVHFSPCSNYINHGFYSFSPCFFYDFYRSNGFGEFICYVLQLNHKNYFDTCPFFKYFDGMKIEDLVDPKREIPVLFAAKKNYSVDLTIPTQGIYDPNRNIILEKEKKSIKQASLYESIVPYSLKPYLKPLRSWLSFLYWTFLDPCNAMLKRAFRKFAPKFKTLKRI